MIPRGLWLLTWLMLVAGFGSATLAIAAMEDPEPRELLRRGLVAFSLWLWAALTHTWAWPGKDRSP